MQWRNLLHISKIWKWLTCHSDPLSKAHVLQQGNPPLLILLSHQFWVGDIFRVIQDSTRSHSFSWTREEIQLKNTTKRMWLVFRSVQSTYFLVLMTQIEKKKSRTLQDRYLFSKEELIERRTFLLLMSEAGIKFSLLHDTLIYKWHKSHWRAEAHRPTASHYNM